MELSRQLSFTTFPLPNTLHYEENPKFYNKKGNFALLQALNLETR